MEDILRQLESLRHFTLRTFLNVFDILLVAFLVYRLLLLVRGTRAWRIVGGIVGFVLLLTLSSPRMLHLDALNWLLEKAALLGPVALVILFFPELRTALEGLGNLGFWPQRIGVIESKTEGRTIEEIVAAVTEMAASSTGALIVVEKGVPLEDVVSNGVALAAKVSAPLLCSIFYDGNPLHDGAVVVRGDVIVAAACRLPLSESSRLDNHAHMRHRAAVGVTDAATCLAIVVSEERGTISIASDGRLRRLANHLELRQILNSELRGVGPDGVVPKRRLGVRIKAGSKR